MRLSIRIALVPALLFLMTTLAFSQKPELYVQTGHSGFIFSVAFSPDGKTIASGSSDNTIKLWDIASGQELRTLTGNNGIVFSVAFSPDGKTLASCDNITIRLWDVVSGRELNTLYGHRSLVLSVAFSPDGKSLVSGSNCVQCNAGDDATQRRDSTIQFWDVASGRPLRTLKGHSHSVTSVAFSPDGQTIASGSTDNTIKLWDVATGQELKTLKDSSAVRSVAFSPDGTILASGNKDSTIKLWDVASGHDLRTLKGHLRDVYSVAFSPDSKTLASGGGDDAVKLWDVASGRELKTLKAQLGSVTAVAFSPDGKKLASGGGNSLINTNNTIRLWDVTSGQERTTLKSHSHALISVAFSPDNKTVASASSDATIKLWNMASGQQLKTLKGSSVAFSPDGKTLASGSDDNTIKLWDVASQQELKTLVGHSPVTFSPDGKTLASGGADNTVKLFDVTSGLELKTLRGHLAVVNSVAFSPDGTTLVSGGRDSALKLWNVASGQELQTLKGHLGGVNSVAFSPDGKTLASGGNDYTFKLWDVASGQELKLPNQQFNLGAVRSVSFSLDGKTLATGSTNGTIKLWDVASGRWRTLFPRSGDVRSVVFSPDGSMLASGSSDGTIKLWEVSSGNNLANLIALNDRDWAVVTPDGLFDGSPAAWSQIRWRFNNDTFNYAPVEAFFSDFYYPGLLTDIFAGKRPKAPSDITQKDRRQAHLKLTLADASPNARLTTRSAVINVEVSQAPAGAQDVRLFRNGSLVKVWRGEVLQSKSSITLETTIPFVAGENQLTAYAFNHDNIKSSDATLTITGADSLKRKGVAYLLAVGVNDYANSQYNLKYAVADAQDFAAELKLQQAKLNNYEHVEVVSLIDRDATKANILKSLADLSVKIQPEDALIIYFAGHGTAQQNRFYLIPHNLGYAGSRTQLDSAGLQNILGHSISDEELQRAVEGIDAGQLSLVIDACNSGQALESEEKRRGPMNSRGLAQLAYEKGMYILTAAQSYQAAQEAERLGHGFLTYALVEEGLKTNAADRDKDGQVLLREWLDYATERVPQMQEDKLEEQRKQGRQLDRIKFVEADSGNERSIQRPRVFYRREAETHPLVVAKP